jgi:hypothetical protein
VSWMICLSGHSFLPSPNPSDVTCRLHMSSLSKGRDAHLTPVSGRSWGTMLSAARWTDRARCRRHRQWGPMRFHRLMTNTPTLFAHATWVSNSKENPAGFVKEGKLKWETRS